VGYFIGTSISFVEEGDLRVFVVDEMKERIIRFGYNNILVSLDSFLTEKPSNFII
jgi:hypothetical protein